MSLAQEAASENGWTYFRCHTSFHDKEDREAMVREPIADALRSLLMESEARAASPGTALLFSPELTGTCWTPGASGPIVMLLGA
jgi:hypothetical protein